MGQVRHESARLRTPPQDAQGADSIRAHKQNLDFGVRSIRSTRCRD
jgi:hypothetical protein